MKNKKIKLLIALLGLLFVITSCSVQERKYRKGYYVDWNKGKSTDLYIAKNNRAASMINIEQKIVAESKKSELLVVLTNDLSKSLPSKKTPEYKHYIKDTCGDIIVMMDGSVINAKVIEISETNVKYKKCNNIDGPVYNVKLEKVIRIEYINGKKEIINHKNLPTTNNSFTKDQNSDKSNKNKPYNSFAIASLVMGIFSFTIFLAILTGPLAFIFGLIANKQLNEEKGSRGKGMATFGIVVGAIVLLILLLLIIGMFI